MHFCILNSIPNEWQLPNSWFQFHNISADYQNFTYRSVSLRRIFLTRTRSLTKSTFFFIPGISWSTATQASHHSPWQISYRPINRTHVIGRYDIRHVLWWEACTATYEIVDCAGVSITLYQHLLMLLLSIICLEIHSLTITLYQHLLMLLLSIICLEIHSLTPSLYIRSSGR